MYMSRNTVLKIHLCFILGLLFLITGCATPLMNAAKSNDIKKVENLLNKGVNVNEKWIAGCTALYEAVRVNSSLETFRLIGKPDKLDLCREGPRVVHLLPAQRH